jgi:hypothetical protein
MSLSIRSARPSFSQLSAQERREALAAMDPASRKQAEQLYGVKDDKAVKPTGAPPSGG